MSDLEYMNIVQKVLWSDVKEAFERKKELSSFLFI